LWAELVYGEEPSWEDPVKFRFAYGDKDRVTLHSGPPSPG